ncbi:unnamed protein product [Rotaria magnacalcarata]|uniref:G-protein coupled receptors family 1 profile domain-containing protein n=1 Tax=Rotaria magnacalcarata TaxID=392030 RepID=A0A819XH04_9BILA|nr:unnamed protein product [Rotaria magnacalcarata]CAF2260530.1 unnamed protein product [Rotaria magnacalcarata]CAF4140933.1 unnamed protein product [Rotaria magnacalcarata]
MYKWLFVGNFCEICYNAARLSLIGAITKDVTSMRDFYLTVFLFLGICGLINNILALTTFLNERIRCTVCGIYLIIFSAFGITLAFTLLTYLITIAQYKNDTYRLLVCHFIPYVPVILNGEAILFTAAIAVERTFIECLNFSIHGNRKRGLVVSVIITVYVTCSNLDEIFIRRLSAYPMGNQVCIYDFERYPTWRRLDIIFSYIHVVVPCVVHVVCSLCVLTTIARWKIFIRGIDNKFFRVWFQELCLHRDFFVPPLCLLVCILPHGIIDHLLNTRIPYSNKLQLRFHIVFVLLLFIPQLFSFILYVCPNRKYWKEFQHTIIFRKICCYFYQKNQRLRRQRLIGSPMIPLRTSISTISQATSISEQTDTSE